MNTCKLPIYFIEYCCSIGKSKELALFATLKKKFSSGHIHDFRHLDLKSLGYPVSRKTYFKYLKTLEQMRLVRGDNEKYRHGKKKGAAGLILAGQNRLLKLYPTKQKLKYVRLDNDKNLRDSIERIVIKHNIERQQFKMKEDSDHNVYRTILTKVGCRTFSKTENIRYTTSLSCKKVANLIGLKSPTTGFRRERKWVKEKFIETLNRFIVICPLTKKNAKEFLYNHPGNFVRDGKIMRWAANQIEIMDVNFGRRKDYRELIA